MSPLEILIVVPRPVEPRAQRSRQKAGFDHPGGFATGGTSQIDCNSLK